MRRVGAEDIWIEAGVAGEGKALLVEVAAGSAFL